MDVEKANRRELQEFCMNHKAEHKVRCNATTDELRALAKRLSKTPNVETGTESRELQFLRHESEHLLDRVIQLEHACAQRMGYNWDMQTDETFLKLVEQHTEASAELEQARKLMDGTRSLIRALVRYPCKKSPVLRSKMSLKHFLERRRKLRHALA